MIEPYKPLFIHLNPASIPEVVAHMQKYLTEHEFVTVDDFGTQFQEYIDAHPGIIKVGSVNGLTGDVVLTSENITMTGESSDTIGTVIATLENVFTGATEESSGAKGLVPAPTNTQTQQYLKATGNFETVSAGEVSSAAVSGAGTVEGALSYFKSHEVSDMTEKTITLNNPTLQAYTFTPIATIQLPEDGELYLVNVVFELRRSVSTTVRVVLEVFNRSNNDDTINTTTYQTGFTFLTSNKTVDVKVYMSNVSGIDKFVVDYSYVKLK